MSYFSKISTGALDSTLGAKAEADSKVAASKAWLKSRSAKCCASSRWLGRTKASTKYFRKVEAEASHSPQQLFDKWWWRWRLGRMDFSGLEVGGVGLWENMKLGCDWWWRLVGWKIWMTFVQSNLRSPAIQVAATCQGCCSAKALQFTTNLTKLMLQNLRLCGKSC